MLEALAPARLAAEWDNCGLMVGRKGVQVHKTALALDPTPNTIQAARNAQAQLLLTHHPLIFRPVKRLDLDDPAIAAAALALKLDLAVVAAHTNLDAAMGGVSRVLADRLGLHDPEPLDPFDGPARYKLTVFAPIGYEDRVRQALFQAGAGRIGAYSGCSYSGRGEGTFRPEEGARPFLGGGGRLERVAESRI
ncbi:MAG: Nif3-like dinuclear metal center hexameric protein, partial [Proteobacteria bacterium]|nr:Nif3-like dinuclear metal center hexameric protein [Pseudomonadota bacterium]